MSTEQDTTRRAVIELLENVKPLALRHPDAPIRGAGTTFEGLLSRAQRAFPASEALAQMTGLLGGDSHTALVAKLSLLKAELAEPGTVELPVMTLTKEGVFFAGEYFDAFRRIAGIVQQSQKTIEIVDGYVDESVLDLLATIERKVEARILTRTEAASKVKTAATAYNKQYGGLAIRTSSAFHDRFVVVDGTDYYHFGASLKDAGHRGFMFSRIEEPTVIKAFGEALAAEWSKATVAL
jgi:hypothetical protein